VKAKHTKITTRLSKKLPGILTVLMRSCIVVPSLFVAAPLSMLAVDAVWLDTPGSDVWNEGSNWSTSPIAPVKQGDTATFKTSTQTLLKLMATATVSGNATVESITFNPGAPPFTINTNGNTLKIEGAGTANASGKPQTITNNGGATGFFNTSTAGSATIINNGSANGTVLGGFTGFHDGSTAGGAAITNNGATGLDGIEGDLVFFDTSTAGNAAITNNGSAISGGSGSTEFDKTSTAGHARIINNGGTVRGASGGLTRFLDSSTASTNIPSDGIVGLVQGVAVPPGAGGGFADVVFKEAQIANSQAANFKITSLGSAGSVVLKFSQDDIPSDILDRNQFTKLFSSISPPDTSDFPPVPAVPSGVIVGLDSQGFAKPNTPNNLSLDQFFALPRKTVTPMEFKLNPGQTIMFSEPNFFAGDSPTMPGVLGPQPLKGTLLGLAKPAFMGSVFVQPTGTGVSVQVGQRIERPVDPITFQVTERLVNGGYTFKPLDPSDPKSLGFGVFSLQAPDPPAPSPIAAVVTTAISTVEADGPLRISDPMYDATTNISTLADAALLSKQDIAVQSVAEQQIANTISPTKGAQTVSLRLSAASIASLTAGQDYWIKTPTASLRLRLQTIDKTNNTVTFAAGPGGIVPDIPAGSLISLPSQLVFHNTTLNAGQGVSLFSANKIRFENSSQIQAFTDVIMQGGGTADLELLQNTVVKASNGQILLDQFRNIAIDSAQLMAAVIKARVVSPTGALMINNSTLAAGSLLRLYAEGSNGTVALSGSVNLTGKQIASPAKPSSCSRVVR
jgi:hypothetical protein